MSSIPYNVENFYTFSKDFVCGVPFSREIGDRDAKREGDRRMHRYPNINEVNGSVYEPSGYLSRFSEIIPGIVGRRFRLFRDFASGHATRFYFHETRQPPSLVRTTIENGRTFFREISSFDIKETGN